MTKLIIFDLGETLVFYEDLGLNWKDHYEEALRRAGRAIDNPISCDEMKRCSEILIYYNTRENPRIFEVKESEVLKRVAEVFKQKVDWVQFEIEFFKYFQRKAKPEETAVETLELLRKKGYKSVVLSDAAYGMPTSFIMEDLEEIQEMLDGVYSSTDIGFRKPHPKGISKIVQDFKSDKDCVILVGNEEKDIETARNFGVRSLLLAAVVMSPLLAM